MKTLLAGLIALFAFSFIPAFAQTQPPPVRHSGGMITKINPSPGVSQYWGSDGGSTTTYDTGLPGYQQYYSQDKHGKYTDSGVVYEPFAPSKPLSVPSGDILETYRQVKGR